MVEKKLVADPNLRQYANRQQDAGNPRDNPFIQVAKYLLDRYHQKVYDRVPDHQERKSWHSSYR
jgi:hypothetical protein